MTTMRDDAPPAALGTPATVALVETDAFCDCGYNLHGQKVWRDPNLELLVCRCPECGKHSAAGRFTGIHSVWLHRVSMAMILAWIVFLLAVFAFLIPMLALWPSLHLESTISYLPTPSTGPGTTNYIMGFRQDQWANRSDRVFERAIALFFGLVNGWMLGAAVATLMWHLRKRAYLFALLPAPVMVLVYWGWTEGPYEFTPDAWVWMVSWIFGYGVLYTALVLVGVWSGRVVARGVLRVLLPKRLLQHLAFLWYRDGKAPPFQKEGVVA